MSETEASGPDPRELLRRSVVLAEAPEVEAAVERMAAEINAYYGDREIVLLIVMTGAVMPAAWLACRLAMPLRMDYVHATRYMGQTEGGDLEFRVPPRLGLDGQDVLIVDDIFDVGVTLGMIEDDCRARGARSVNSAVLVRKLHDRGIAASLPRFIGLELGDRYLFGCGMDVHEHWRQLREIRALEDA
jgi:hypoxanthine phosphoribosyltransferase